MYLWLILIPVIIFISASGIILWYITPDVKWLHEKNPQETAFMRFRDRQNTNNRSERHWKWVELSQISPYLIQSIIASEDFNFLTHRGFCWDEMWKSLIVNLQAKKIVKGGSGITQQLAKNLFLRPSRSILRKIKEAIITFKLERELTKWRILEIYLNVIEWENWIYGAEEASRFYYNKSASELTLSEAIRLASVIPNPRTLSPLDKTNDFLKLNNERVLAGILQHGWISRAKYEQVSQELYQFHSSGNKPPSLIPFSKVSPKLLSSDYWISKLNDPDKIIMTDSEIDIYNQRARLISGGIDVFGLPDFIEGKEVKDKILEVAGLSSSFLMGFEGDSNQFIDELNLILTTTDVLARYDSKNNPLTKSFYYGLLGNLNLEELPCKKEVNYTLVIERTDALAWPVDELIMSKPYDYGFNVLQQSSIYLGSSVAVIHTSKDGKWVFIRSQYFDGWVKKEDLAFTSREEALSYPAREFLVVTDPKVRTVSGIDLHMGTRVSLLAKSSKGYEVIIPTKGNNGEFLPKNDFLSSNGVNEGFLPYTKANIVTQAFKHFESPYSWGGNKDGVDCSIFIQDVFNVFGIKLPRNSSSQIKVGKVIAKFSDTKKSIKDKLAGIRYWEPALTLLAFPSHIMLYLGKEGKKHFAIHAIWGISEKDYHIIDVNEVAVTDLELGHGGKKGSLFQRINEVSIVCLDSTGLKSLLKDFNYALHHHPWHLVTAFKYVTIFIVIGLIIYMIV